MTVETDRPTFQPIGDGTYQLTVLSLGIQLTVDRLRKERSQTHGELAVACDFSARAVDGFLSIADFNLSSEAARSARAKLLADRSDAPDVDWFRLIEELCVRTLAAERQGAPARYLHTFDDPDPHATEWDVRGWPWLRQHMMITFADGGSLKSYLALYGVGTLAQHGVAVGYCDWELSGSEHKQRLRQLFGDDLPPVAYFRCDRPLVDEVDRLTREVGRLGLDYLVFDSAGFGTAGPPEAAEHALAYCRALRQIGVGAHVLAHVNRSENGDQKPFGSSFWHNSARSTWFAKQTATSVDGRTSAVGLFNRKSNLTRLHPAIGFQFDFGDPSRVTVAKVDVATIADLAAQVPLWQRIKTAVAYRPMTLARLAEELDSSVDSIDKATRRRSSLFTRVEGDDGVTKIALIERRAS